MACCDMGFAFNIAYCLLLFFAVYVDDPLYVASIFSMQMFLVLLGVLYLIVYYFCGLLRGVNQLFCLLALFSYQPRIYTTTILLMVLFVGGFLFINLTLSIWLAAGAGNKRLTKCFFN